MAVVDGATSSAGVIGGCGRSAPEQAVGSQPFGLALNQSTNTVYASNLGAPGVPTSMSMFRGRA